jgi:hypothetical protein
LSPRYARLMRSATTRSALRKVAATVLLAAALAAIVVEPFPKGVVLLALTEEHGVDAGDLPAIALLVAAGWLLRSW